MQELELKDQETAWMQFVRMIHDEFPHCKVENLIVREGKVWGYDKIRYSEIPTCEATKVERIIPKSLSPAWEWLMRQCRELGDGSIPEIHFRNGNPIVLYGEVPGKVLTQPRGKEVMP